MHYYANLKICHGSREQIPKLVDRATAQLLMYGLLSDIMVSHVFCFVLFFLLEVEMNILV